MDNSKRKSPDLTDSNSIDKKKCRIKSCREPAKNAIRFSFTDQAGSLTRLVSTIVQIVEEVPIRVTSGQISIQAMHPLQHSALTVEYRPQKIVLGDENEQGIFIKVNMKDLLKKIQGEFKTNMITITQLKTDPSLSIRFDSERYTMRTSCQTNVDYDNSADTIGNMVAKLKFRVSVNVFVLKRAIKCCMEADDVVQFCIVKSEQKNMLFFGMLWNNGDGCCWSALNTIVDDKKKFDDAETFLTNDEHVIDYTNIDPSRMKTILSPQGFEASLFEKYLRVIESNTVDLGFTETGGPLVILHELEQASLTVFMAPKVDDE